MPTREARSGSSTTSDWSTDHSLGPLIGRDGGAEIPGENVSNNVRVGREKERENP